MDHLDAESTMETLAAIGNIKCEWHFNQNVS